MSEEPKKAGDDEEPQEERVEQDEDARAFILSRRAKFVAAAIATGVAGAGYVAYSWPQPCLSQIPPQADPEPRRSPADVPDEDAATHEGKVSTGARGEEEEDASDELDEPPPPR